MIEAEWLRSVEPGRMLAHLEGKADPRKLRLFAVASARLMATWTGSKCILGENNNVEWVYDSSNRETPIGFRVYPYDAGAGET